MKHKLVTQGPAQLTVTLPTGRVGAAAKSRAVQECKNVIEAVRAPLHPLVAETAVEAEWSLEVVWYRLAPLMEITLNGGTGESAVKHVALEPRLGCGTAPIPHQHQVVETVLDRILNLVRVKLRCVQLTETLLHGQPGVNAVKVVVWVFKLVTGPASIPGLQMVAATARAQVLRHRNVKLNLVSLGYILMDFKQMTCHCQKGTDTRQTVQELISLIRSCRSFSGGITEEFIYAAMEC